MLFYRNTLLRFKTETNLRPELGGAPVNIPLGTCARSCDERKSILDGTEGEMLVHIRTLSLTGWVPIRAVEAHPSDPDYGTVPGPVGLQGGSCSGK